MEAENRVREAALQLAYDPKEGFLNLKGDAAVTRPNGNSLTSEYGERLGKTIQDVEADLANDAQREAFRQRAAQINQSFRGQTTQHELQEFRAYSASVAEGTIAIRQRELVLDARDPEKVAGHTNMIAAAVGELGKLNGWSATDIERRARSVVRQGHRLVLDDAIEKGDIEFADLYRMRYKDAMDADDILAIEGKWNVEFIKGGPELPPAFSTERRPTTSSPT
jgi:soluble lytic murein transglycosylase